MLASKVLEVPTPVQVLATPLGCSPKLKDKALLLKTIHSSGERQFKNPKWN